MSDTELIARLFPTEGIHACEEVGKVRLPVDMNKIASLHEVTLRMEHVKIRYGSRTILKRFGLGNQERGEVGVIRSEWRW